MKAVQNSQLLPPKSSVQLPDGDEGGLNLGQVLGALQRRLPIILGVTAGVIAASALKAMTATPIYTSGFEILTKSVTVESEVLSSVPQTLSSRQENQSTAGEIIDATKIKVLKSPSVLSPVLEKLKARYPDLTYNQLAQVLQITAPQPDVLSVSFSNPDQELTGSVLDLVAEAYLNYSLEERQRDVRQGIVFVEEQLPKLQNQVSIRQEQLQQFRQEYNLITPESLADQLSKQMSTLSQDLIQTQTQLKEMLLLYQELRDDLSQSSLEMAGSSPLTESPRFQRLLDRLVDLDSQLAQDSALYLEKSPELNVLQTQRNNLVPLLQQEGFRVEQQVASRIQQLQNQERAIQSSINILNQQINRLSGITRRYNDIQRELKIATDNLDQFLAKREGLRIDAAQRQIPWQLLTAPGEPVPSAASMRRTLALGTILGLLLGIGVALLVDKLSSVLHTTKEVKDITRLPILGVIPTHKGLEKDESAVQWSLQAGGEYLTESTDSTPLQMMPIAFLEAFRSLNVNLRLISPDKRTHAITISSATAESGKTTVAFYLAQAAAAMGQRVLLVDVDLRRPSLHRRLSLLGTMDAKGLTDAVSFSDDWRDAIQKVPWEKNLFVMQAGSLAPDPTRILSSQFMQQMIKESRAEFDLIIYDAPPLLGFADAYLLASQTDGILLVTRLGQLKRSLLEQVLEDMRVASAPMLGVVINDSGEKRVDMKGYY